MTALHHSLMAIIDDARQFRLFVCQSRDVRAKSDEKNVRGHFGLDQRLSDATLYCDKNHHTTIRENHFQYYT